MAPGWCEVRKRPGFTGCSQLASTRAALSSPPPAAFRPAVSHTAILAGAPSPGQPRFPFPAVACFPAPKGLRLAELGTYGERPPGEACGTLGRGPCSRPFPVCMRLFCYVKITLSRNVFFKKRIWHKKTCMKQAKGKKDMQADYGRRNMAAFTEELPHEFEALLRLSPGTIFGMTPGTL